MKNLEIVKDQLNKALELFEEPNLEDYRDLMYDYIFEANRLLNDINTSNYLYGYAKETCGHCGLKRTEEGHDGCVGTLKNVMNACCGHGEVKMAYVQFNHENYNEEPNKIRLSGEKALNYIKINRN